MKKNITYGDAGVSIERGNELVERIKRITSKRKKNPDVLSGIGGFAGLYSIPSGYREGVLVSSTDGVGTKLRVAFDMGRHDTIGYDLVAMSVNDILVAGAKPLFFLDYFATSRLDVEVAASVVEGISKACESCDVTLLGGETAELPDFYAPGEYDLAGFATGIVERSEIPSPLAVTEGDIVFALPSSGLHSNGFSLARKIFFEELSWDIHHPFGESGSTIGDMLLEPTRIYTSPVLELLRLRLIKTMVHVTGGGLVENPPRSMPHGLGMDIKTGSWDIPAIFTKMSDAGVSTEEMYRTFNMGLGFLMTVSEKNAVDVRTVLKSLGEPYYEVGVISGRDSDGKETRFI
ncbi:MAG: phosphoribosylformylglycinamidine cyclo-ligase [Deltaproteobacteria bacterium]|nr:phosphoribosylformylglycinamidine cyclo-ligase [Deltaproteobacteria bacterium]